MRNANHGRFRNISVLHKDAFQFRRANPVAGYIHHVINTTQNPVVTVLVAAGAITGEIILPAPFTPVGVLEALRVAINPPQHSGPWFLDRKNPRFHRLPLVREDVRFNPKERNGRTTGFGGGRTGHGRKHVSSRFRLPPGVHNRTTFGTHFFMIPHPRFRIDRFTDRPEKTQGTQILMRQPVVAPFHKGADRGRRGVKSRDLVALNDLPKATLVREIRCALIHDLRDAILKNPIYNVTVTGNPAHVGGTPINVVRLQIKNVF